MIHGRAYISFNISSEHSKKWWNTKYVGLKFEYSIIRVDCITGCILLFQNLDILNFYLLLELFQNSSWALLNIEEILNWRNPARLFGKRYLPESGTGRRPASGLYNCSTIETSPVVLPGLAAVDASGRIVSGGNRPAWTKCHLWRSDVDYRFGVVNVRRKEPERARTSWRQKKFTENITHLLKLLTHLLKL